MVQIFVMFVFRNKNLKINTSAHVYACSGSTKYLVPGLPSEKGPLSQSLSLAVEELLLAAT